MKRKIGIIDAKVGGLHLLKKLSEQFPTEDFLYFDVKYFTSLLERDLEKDINHLLSFVLSHDLKGLIIASDLIASLIMEFEIKIPIPYILISPSLVEFTNKYYEQKIMLFLAKERVIETNVYSKNLKADQLFTVPGDNLTVLVQEDEIKTSRSFREVINLLLPYSRKHVEVLVSGCSNISLLKTEILEVLPTVEIISLDDVIIKQLELMLLENGLLNIKGRGKIFIISENDKRTVKSRLKQLKIKPKTLVFVERVSQHFE